MSSNIISIHQPNFLPWIGYFYKIIKSDIFVILDDVQYTKNSFINRNKIKTPDGEQWLTIPVKHSGNFGSLIKDTEIDSPERTFKKVQGTLTANYKKAKYFDNIFTLLETCFQDKTNLSILNENLIKSICNYLKIGTKILKSSEILQTNLHSTDKLLHICKELGGSSYLAGFGSRKYQESQKFEQAEIICDVYDFAHPTYPQLWRDFIPNLSVIDLLFNCGPSSYEIILNCNLKNFQNKEL